MRVEPLELSTNQKIILDLIRRNELITRAELSKKSGLTAGAITQNCRELLYLSLICEGEKNKGQRGQPSLPLLINENGGISIGISFSMGFIDLTVLNLRGQSIATVRQPHEESQPFEKTLLQVRQLVERTLKTNHLTNARLIGIGYSVSGYLVDGKHRYCVEPLKHWRELDLESEFRHAIEAPTWVENNVNAAVLGEFYTGEWHSASSMVFIEMGHGFGGGVIMDSKLMRGFTGNAGEIGAFFPHGTRPSFTDLNRRLQSHELDFSQVDETHQVVNEWLENIHSQVALATASCINWLDPEIIVFGGRMPTGILQKVTSNLLANPLFQHGERPLPLIEVSTFGEAISSIGAAMLPAYHTLWGD